MEQTFEEFLSSQSVHIPLVEFLINLAITAGLSYLLSLVYIRFGSSLSNRRTFARTFLILATTTMLIIAIVKSSLALSLGLVGALSIVRFRAAIKEPEELALLFLNIAIGLGMGADQRMVTLAGFTLITGFFILGRFRASKSENENLYLSIAIDNPQKEETEQVVAILNNNCKEVKIKRIDNQKDIYEGAFLVEFEDYGQFEKCQEEILALSDSTRLTLLDNKALV
jgi:hypothetical protein